MELSKLTDELEIQLQKEREENCKSVIDTLQKLLGVNLYEAAKTSHPIDTFNANCFFLLDKFEGILYQALETSGVPVSIFWKEALVSFVLAVTRNRGNVEFLKQLFIKRGIMKDYREENGSILISSVLGPIQFRKVELDEEVETFIKDNVDITSACHESALFLLKKNREYIAVTAFAYKNLNGRFLHSFVLDGDNVIDITANLYMKKEDYYRLYDIEEIRKVTYQEFLNDSERAEQFDESGTMFPILRNAMHFYFTATNEKQMPQSHS